MMALQDEEIQKKGLVLVLWCLGQNKFHSDRPGKLSRSFWFLPIRLVAVHACYHSRLMELAMKMMSHEMEIQHVCRLWGHNGTL
jgi:hypothetical protein